MGCLINQYRSELELAQSRVTRTNASATYNIRSIQDLLLALANKSLVLPLVIAAQLALLRLEHDQLLQLDVSRAVRDLLVQSQERDTRVEGLA